LELRKNMVRRRSEASEMVGAGAQTLVMLAGAMVPYRGMASKNGGMTMTSRLG
jgi:hypothetical protein